MAVFFAQRDFVPDCRAYRLASLVAPSAKTVPRTVFFRFAPSLFESLLLLVETKKENTDLRSAFSFFLRKSDQKVYVWGQKRPKVLWQRCSTNWNYSLLSAFFCQDFFPQCGQRIYLVLPICGAKLTALYVGTYLCPHSLHV